MTTFLNNLLGFNNTPSVKGLSGKILEKVGEMKKNHERFVTDINIKLNILNAIVTQTKQKINQNNQRILENPEDIDDIEELQQQNVVLQQQLEDIQNAVDNYLLKMDFSKDNAQILDRIDTMLKNQPVGNAVTINREKVEPDEDEVTTKGLRGDEQLANDKQEDEDYLRAYGVLPNKNKKDEDKNKTNEANEDYLRAYGVPPPSTSIRPQSPPGPPPGPLNLPPGNPDHSSEINPIKGGYVYKSPFRSRSTKKYNKSSRRTRTHGGRYRRKRQTKFKRRYSIF